MRASRGICWGLGEAYGPVVVVMVLVGRRVLVRRRERRGWRWAAGSYMDVVAAEDELRRVTAWYEERGAVVVLHPVEFVVPGDWSGGVVPDDRVIQDTALEVLGIAH